jgi:hypothetical protein
MPIKKSHNEFLKELSRKQPELLNNIKLLEEYNGADTLILIQSKYGLCKISARGLLKTKNITILSAVNPTEFFIKKAQEVHGDLYDYSKVVYKSCKEKVEIVSKYGSFWQTPDTHLRGSGCPILGTITSSIKQSSNTEEFIAKAKELHSDKYDYSLVNYISAKNKINIKCKVHGNFKQAPDSHLSGQGCPKCGALLITKKLSSDTKEFIKKAILIHKNLYDYSKVNYIKNNTKVEIVCKKHGSFWQSPGSHLSGSGCLKCGKNHLQFSLNKRLNIYIEKVKIIHNNKYNYDLVNYKNATIPVEIICPTHGSFFKGLYEHSKGSGCPICSRKEFSKNKSFTSKEFIDLSNKKHNFLYTYLNVEYKNNSSVIDIICSEHGLFKQKAACHLKGSGCPKCGRSKNVRGWTYSRWEEQAKSSKKFDSFKLYIIKCWNDNEIFYKIGKTYTTIKHRFQSKKSLPYNWEIVKLIEGNSREISKLEDKLKSENKNFKYTPLLSFGGKHECFHTINNLDNE